MAANAKNRSNGHGMNMVHKSDLPPTICDMMKMIKPIPLSRNAIYCSKKASYDNERVLRYVASAYILACIRQSLGRP